MYEADSEKAKSNLTKHNVSFDQAYEAINDPYAIYERDSCITEIRYDAIGMSSAGILYVVFTERKRDRIISARRASPEEEARYYQM